MTNRRVLLSLGAAFLVGVVVGAVSIELYHRSVARQDRELFSAKLRCERLSRKYATDNSVNGAAIGLASSMTAILKIDYSIAAHSCIAVTETNTTGLDLTNYQVVDIVTNELYGGNLCKKTDEECAEKTMDKTNLIFGQAVAGKIKPLGR